MCDNALTHWRYNKSYKSDPIIQTNFFITYNYISWKLKIIILRLQTFYSKFVPICHILCYPVDIKNSKLIINILKYTIQIYGKGSINLINSI